MARWTNWAGNQVARPVEIARPRSDDEVASLVARASRDGHAVKTVGSGHSFTANAATNGMMLDISRMRGIRAHDEATNHVSVRAGTTLSDLNVMLDELGLALPNLGDIAYQTVAGAISTSTHGTGKSLTGLAGQVRGFTIVTAQGEVLEASDSVNAEIFRAGRVSLGALGVITEVTLQAVPAFRLHAVEGAMRLTELLDSVEELVESNDHFEFFWIPHTGWALTKRNNRTEEPLNPLPRVRGWVDKVLLENYAFGAVCAVGRRIPSQIPRLARALPASGTREYIDKSFKIFASQRLVKFYEMEYSIPRGHVAEVMREVVAMVDARGHKLNFPVECRFTASDDIPLSTSYGRESAYIAVHIYKGMDYEPYFRDVEAIMRRHEGRPHWGKVHFQSAAELQTVYPRFGDFLAIRERLDPGRVFANDYTRQVLGN